MQISITVDTNNVTDRLNIPITEFETMVYSIRSFADISFVSNKRRKCATCAKRNVPMLVSAVYAAVKDFILHNDYEENIVDKNFINLTRFMGLIQTAQLEKQAVHFNKIATRKDV